MAFQKALTAVIAETRRLHALGLRADDAVKQANWGEYAQWFLAEQQGADRHRARSTRNSKGSCK